MGSAVFESSITFMSQAAIEEGVPAQLGLRKVIRPCKGIRGLAKADLKHNGNTPEIKVDAETYQVFVDGELATCEPASELPMTQRYFLF